jgi:response regulator RpfG family c-di-GMP phosphodiesterase
MPEEQNGNRDTRLDRIERALELIIDDHERFRADLRQLLTAQVLQKDALEQQAKIVEQHTHQIGALNTRVDNLVSAIGEFIRRLPPPQ